MPSCLSCLRGFHGTCRGTCDCTHAIDAVIVIKSDEVSTVSRQGRGYARDAGLKDQQSTGRKRAAKLYPLDFGAGCEWAGKSDVGGGVTIDGCGIRGTTVPGLQQCRHHGPDYNTLNNEPGNVHRICTSCHNSWHAVNDPVKDEAYLKLYGAAAGGSNFKNSKVLKRDDESESAD